MITFKTWDTIWTDEVFSWYESGEYSQYFRHIRYPVGRSQFVNYPDLLGGWVYGIFENSHELKGLLQVYGYDPISGHLSLGIIIKKEYQNTGIGSKACYLALEREFESKRLVKVKWEFLSDNEAMISGTKSLARLLEDKNYDTIESTPFYEGRLKKEVYLNGKSRDKIMCAILVKQFKEISEKINGKMG